MAIESVLKGAQGTWAGMSRLHLSWLPEDQRVTESPSTLEVFVDPLLTYCLIQYTWLYDGAPQTGVMLFAGPEGEGETTGGWTDSWHQNSSVMSFKGSSGADGIVNLLGHYSYEDSGEWGWRIELEMGEEKTLALRMTNISPDGIEEWAVAALYHRAS